MKLSISSALTFFFLSFCLVLFISFLNFTMQMQRMDDYHFASIHEMESSDFSPYVIESIKSNSPYEMEITEKSIQEDLRIYEVKTSTTLAIPIIGYETTYQKQSIAR